jgi:hypothetical protein
MGLFLFIGGEDESIRCIRGDEKIFFTVKWSGRE